MLCTLGVVLVLGVGINAHAWLTGHAGSWLPTTGGDVAEQVWFLAWLPHALLHGGNPLLSHQLFAGSGGVNLMVNTSEFAPGLVLAPITLTGGPILAFNVGVLVAPMLSAWPMYVLCRRLVASPVLAGIGGVLWAFTPYVISNLSSGRFHQTVQFIEPVVVLLAMDLCSGRRSPVRTGLWAAAAMVVQFFTGSEQLAMAAIEVGIGLVVLLVVRRDLVMQHLRSAAVAVGIATGVTAVVLAYPLWFEFLGPRHTTGSPWGDEYLAGNPLVGFVQAPVRFGHGASEVGLLGTPWGGSEPLAYLGWGAILSCLAITLWRRHDRRVQAIAAVGLVNVVLSFGTTVTVSPGSSALLSWAPWRLAAGLPVVDQLIVDRFAQMVNLAVILLLVLGWQALLDALGDRQPGARVGLVGLVVAVTVVPQVLAASAPFPSVTDEAEALFFAHFAEHARPNERLLVFPYIDSGFSTSSSPMVFQAVSKFRYALVGGYVLVPTTHGTASAWRVLPSGGERALQQLMTPFTPTLSTAPQRRLIAATMNARRVTSVALLHTLYLDNLAAAQLTAIVGAMPRQHFGILEWRLTHRVHPYDLSNAAIVGCVNQTLHHGWLVTARCVVEAGTSATKSKR